MTATTDTARAHIDAVLYEEGVEYGFNYDFSTLVNQFEDAYADAILAEDDLVTIKVPSYYELTFNVTTVGLALGR